MAGSWDVENIKDFYRLLFFVQLKKKTFLFEKK